MGGMEITPAQAPTKPRLGRYDIDPASSAVRFRTRHLFGLAPVRGRFQIRAGTVDVTEPASESWVRVEIDTASLKSGNPARDASVRSPRFLDASRYPVMVFVAEKMDGQDLLGTLTVGAVARPVRLPVRVSGLSAGSFTAQGTVRLDRTEFGVTASPGLAARYLDVSLEVRCVARS
jgi:polyisoprenoid-binding protein YceI